MNRQTGWREAGKLGTDRQASMHAKNQEQIILSEAKCFVDQGRRSYFQRKKKKEERRRKKK